MTLHEAIIKVLEESGKEWMTTQEIADVLNKNKYYTKKDGSPISAFQVHGRTRNYSPDVTRIKKNLFKREGSKVGLL